MNKQQHFNNLLQNEKFTAHAIDQGTSLKEIIKEKKGKLSHLLIIIFLRSK